MDDAATPREAAHAIAEARARDGKIDLRIWLRLLACSAVIERQVRSRLRADFETTLPRFDVLAQLDRAPQGLTMGELSKRLMVSNGNITGLIERLEGDGLVSRKAASQDRRRHMVELTPKGRRAFAAWAPAHAGWVGALMSGLSEDEMRRLHELLGALKRSVETSLNEVRSE